MRLAVTGEASFARRHRGLFTSITKLCKQVEFATSDTRTFSQRCALAIEECRFAAKHVLSGDVPLPMGLENARRLRRRFLFSPSSFERKSAISESNLRRLSEPPQAVLHLFGLYRPYWAYSSTPFVYYLDYTTALARRNWPPNVPALTASDYEDWLHIEGDSFRRASHVFAMSELVARSLRADYGVEEKKVSVVGSGGRFQPERFAAKTFGSKRILFNGNPFGRKGGDVVLAAFKLVREVVREATLVIVGTKLRSIPDGVINPGFVSDEGTMALLFRQADLVVAPALADPYPGFLIEAMSYGVPCIASDVDGIPEIVDHGTNGTILPISNPQRLAEAIVSLLGDEATLHAYSEAAREKAASKFEWEPIAHSIVDRLDAILSNDLPH